MASATITGVHVCGGGEHVVLRLTVGAQNFDFSYEMDELIGGIPPDDRRLATLVIAKFHCTGMTKAQARTALAGGVDVETV
jgi:hypothetical protein